MAIAIDTLAYARRLREAGFSESEVRAGERRTPKAKPKRSRLR